ncbi:nitrate- and nitrite sensing domain-containing protein, partial [Nocardia abscessus]|uniref:nitrate- and nitrite sensing domain-containing protein n=1 Tax=Nocardia abscessus TaxID=120957 RepID=UPI00313B2491
MVRSRRRPELSGGTRLSTPGEQQGSGSAIVRPRTIRGQLARILVVSLVLVLALLGAMVAREVDAYRGSRDTAAAVSLALAVQDLVHEAQRERGLTNGLLGGDGRLLQPVADQRGAVGPALRELGGGMGAHPPRAGPGRAAPPPPPRRVWHPP